MIEYVFHTIIIGLLVKTLMKNNTPKVVAIVECPLDKIRHDGSLHDLHKDAKLYVNNAHDFIKLKMLEGVLSGTDVANIKDNLQKVYSFLNKIG